jgi:hypothetical protein
MSGQLSTPRELFEDIDQRFANGKMMHLRQISYPVAKDNSRCGIFS